MGRHVFAGSTRTLFHYTPRLPSASMTYGPFPRLTGAHWEDSGGEGSEVGAARLALIAAPMDLSLLSTARRSQEGDRSHQLDRAWIVR